jgi:hypothetical protein
MDVRAMRDWLEDSGIYGPDLHLPYGVTPEVDLALDNVVIGLGDDDDVIIGLVNWHLDGGE